MGFDIKAHIKKARPNLKDNSAEAYALALRTLYQKMGNKGEVLDFNYLKDYDAVTEALEIYRPTTRKNMLNAVIVALKCKAGVDCSKYDKLRDKYNKDYEDEHKGNVKNRKQRANWVEWSKFEKMLEYFDKEVRRLRLRRKPTLTPSEYVLLGDYVIVKFYHDYPLRNDLHDVRVGSARDAKDSDSNYLERSKNSMTLILREYKTSKKYGEKRIELNSKLTGLLRDYLRHNKTGWLLINERTGEPMSGHNITTRLQRITKDRLGKKVGSNMLRHSYLSHKYADTTEEMKKDSNIMGHSVEVHQKFYVKSS
jgi:integrase